MRMKPRSGFRQEIPFQTPREFLANSTTADRGETWRIGFCQTCFQTPQEFWRIPLPFILGLTNQESGH